MEVRQQDIWRRSIQTRTGSATLRASCCEPWDPQRSLCDVRRHPEDCWLHQRSMVWYDVWWERRFIDRAELFEDDKMQV